MCLHVRKEFHAPIEDNMSQLHTCMLRKRATGVKKLTQASLTIGSRNTTKLKCNVVFIGQLVT